MSSTLEAKAWLERNGLYPGPGLRTVLWSPDRNFLAAVTLRDWIIVYDIPEIDVLWVSETEKGLHVAGVEFMSENRLVCRCRPPPSNGGAGDAVPVEVEWVEGRVRIEIVKVTQPCRTFGTSKTGRMLLLARGKSGTEAPGLLDLGRWNGAEAGRRDADLTVIRKTGFEEDLERAWISPDGTRMVICVRRRVSDYFLDIRDDSRTRPLPEYPWAAMNYSWSPDSRWFAVAAMEQMPPDWDVPVGGGALHNYIALHDGNTGEERWKREVETVWAPFEWTSDGRLEAAKRYWDPETGRPSF